MFGLSHVFCTENKIKTHKKIKTCFSFLTDTDTDLTPHSAIFLFNLVNIHKKKHQKRTPKQRTNCRAKITAKWSAHKPRISNLDMYSEQMQSKMPSKSKTPSWTRYQFKRFNVLAFATHSYARSLSLKLPTTTHKKYAKESIYINLIIYILFIFHSSAFFSLCLVVEIGEHPK